MLEKLRCLAKLVDISDVFGIIGLICLNMGVKARYGADVALIMDGVIFMVLSYLRANDGVSIPRKKK